MNIEIILSISSFKSSSGVTSISISDSRFQQFLFTDLHSRYYAVIFDSLSCCLSRKTLVNYNCPTVTRFFSCPVPLPLLPLFRSATISPFPLPSVSALSIFRVSFPRARYTLKRGWPFHFADLHREPQSFRDI